MEEVGAKIAAEAPSSSTNDSTVDPAGRLLQEAGVDWLDAQLFSLKSVRVAAHAVDDGGNTGMVSAMGRMPAIPTTIFGWLSSTRSGMEAASARGSLLLKSK